MHTSRIIHAVDSHTEGMPTRVVTGGLPAFPGGTMAERREWFLAHSDHVRRLLMFEPRGHSAMSGAILQPPTRPDADVGVLFIEVSGVLPMCGHGAMGVATVLLETGMVAAVEPVTTIRLDTPAGLVVAEVGVAGGRAEHVTITNVPSFSMRSDAHVHVPGYGTVTYDLAFGGNFYAILPASRLGIDLRRDRANAGEVMAAGLALMEAINASQVPVHPERPDIRGCHHVYLADRESTPARSRHAMVIHPGWFDRSPCGTGTSARMAQLHARGELALGVDFVNESYLGTTFTGRLVSQTQVGGRAAVVPTITGRAWLTGTAQFFLDPTDPFPEGFLL